MNLAVAILIYKIVCCVSHDYHKKVHFGASHTNRNCTVDSAHIFKASQPRGLGFTNYMGTNRTKNAVDIQ